MASKCAASACSSGLSRCVSSFLVSKCCCGPESPGKTESASLKEAAAPQFSSSVKLVEKRKRTKDNLAGGFLRGHCKEGKGECLLETVVMFSL